MVILLLLVFGLRCGDEEETPDGPDFKLGSMTATINDIPWESWRNFATASRNTGETEVEGHGTGLLGADTCDVALFFGNPVVGTIELGGETNDINWCDVFFENDTNWYHYSTYHANATGSAVITSITANRIAGTFSFSAYCIYGEDGECDSLVVTDGTFDLPIFDLPWKSK